MTDVPAGIRQRRVGFGFGAQTTAAQVLGDRRLDGQTTIVTGGYSGLGLHTTRVLAEAGARVIVPARRPQAAAEALRGVRGTVEVEALDLSDPASIDAFAARFRGTQQPLDLLVDSAGVMALPLHRDRAGNELQLSVNHLGHFRLAARLWEPLRRATNGARVVSVSSLGHQLAGVDLGDPNFMARAYDKWIAYGQSKSANALFAVALDARGEDLAIRAFSVHPGAIPTPLARHLTQDDLRWVGAIDDEGRPTTDGFKSVPQGAATIVFAATDARLDEHGGAYLEDCDVAELVETGDPADHGVRAWAVDPHTAEELWDLSERLTNLSFMTPG